SSLNAIQEETGITLNAISDIDSFIKNIHEGHWDIVLQTLKNLKLSNKSLMELYEQMIIELIEMREIAAARSLLRQTDPMDLLKQILPLRYLKLENLLSKTYFESNEVCLEKNEGTKSHLVFYSFYKALIKEVYCVSPSRLLTLLGQSLKWQKTQGLLLPGTKVDLFRGRAIMTEFTEETFPKQLGLSIEFAPNTHPQVLAFSLDGQYLVSGSSDGFIEIWNFVTGKLRKDLKYQAQIWRVSSGQCIFRLENAHKESINCLMFGRDSNQLFTGSTDGLIRLHSLKNGNILKEFASHQSFVNSICYSHDLHHIISCSSDATIKIWSAKSAECSNTFKINCSSSSTDLSINCVLIRPSSPDEYIVCNSSTIIIIINKDGQMIKSYNNCRHDAGGEFVLAIMSPKGNWLYPITQDGTMYCLNLNTGIYEHNMKV
ncbi:hypothetical protein MXB_6, partial [Myxobolus squamalis]